MEVTDAPIERVIPYARNPRRNGEAVAAVAASIAEFGWRQPIVVDEQMVIVAGHTHYEAAKRLGLTSVPVHVARGLSPAQLRAYRLMDNRLHQNATWDDDLLKLELADLKLDEFDLSLTGFDDDELARLLAEAPTDGLTDEDDVPEPPAAPVTFSSIAWRREACQQYQATSSSIAWSIATRMKAS
jgi:ParB-like chromosome segregation protein Spo0J